MALSLRSGQMTLFLTRKVIVPYFLMWRNQKKIEKIEPVLIK